MIQKKICMLGAFSVGKTCLVARFVKSMFSEAYHTTVGVKIDKKSINANGTDLNLILWDLAGEDEFQKVQMTYLRGAAGFLLVVDGTRKNTLDTAHVLKKRAEEAGGDVPFVLVLNKCDLVDEWEIDDETIAALTNDGWTVIRSSAKTGEGVEESFQHIASAIIGSA